MAATQRWLEMSAQLDGGSAHGGGSDWASEVGGGGRDMGTGTPGPGRRGGGRSQSVHGRDLHSSAFQLNLSCWWHKL